MVPSFAAGTITGEKERQTYEMLLASPMQPWAIVLGKLLAALCHLAVLVFCSLPIVMLCLPLGGVSPYEVLATYIGMAASVTLFGMICVAASSYFTRTIAALVVSYFIVLPLTLVGVLFYSITSGTSRLVLVGGVLADMLPGGRRAPCCTVTSRRLLHPPDVGAEAKDVVDPDLEQKMAVGMVIRSDQFPDRLFAPPKRNDLMIDGANPVFDKEMRSELFGQGTLMLRLVIQLSMLLALPLMAVCLYIKASWAHWYTCYVVLFNVLVGPVFSAGTITSERERQTLELLLTTAVSPWHILTGKLFSGLRVSCVLTAFMIWPLFLAWLLPPWTYWADSWTMLRYLVIIVLTTLTTTTLAMFCSVIFSQDQREPDDDVPGALAALCGAGGVLGFCRGVFAGVGPLVAFGRDRHGLGKPGHMAALVHLRQPAGGRLQPAADVRRRRQAAAALVAPHRHGLHRVLRPAQRVSARRDPLAVPSPLAGVVVILPSLLTITHSLPHCPSRLAPLPQRERGERMVPARPFGRNQRRIGRKRQTFGRLILRRWLAEDKPGTGSDLGKPGFLSRDCQAAADAIDNRGGFRFTGRPKQQAELVATQPGDEIALPQIVVHRPADVLQQPVARHVAPRIVDFLELIEVQHGQAKRTPGIGFLKSAGEFEVPRPAIGKARQRVGHGRLGQFVPHSVRFPLLAAEADRFAQQSAGAAKFIRREIRGKHHVGRAAAGGSWSPPTTMTPASSRICRLRQTAVGQDNLGMFARRNGGAAQPNPRLGSQRSPPTVARRETRRE